MDLYRFYVPDLRPQTLTQAGVPVELPADQAHHARTVLRLEPGTQVGLFDGAGAWTTGKILRADKRGVAVGPNMPLTIDEPPTPTLTLATAVPKGERAEWLIEQASQLNVSAVQWLACDRGVVKPREGGGKMDKWRRLAVESAKQCGRNHLLDVRAPVALSEILHWTPAPLPILWLDPGPAGASVAKTLTAGSATVLALIGPEGGWSPAERKTLEDATAAQRVTRVRLTQTVLRIETACAAVAAIVMGAK
jgi:16S rRNA (uracil1498-N3)-methyltransferase